MKLAVALLKAAQSRTACVVVDKGEGNYSISPLPDGAAYVFKGNSFLPVPMNGDRAYEWDQLFTNAMSGKLAPVPGKAIKRRKLK